MILSKGEDISKDFMLEVSKTYKSISKKYSLNKINPIITFIPIYITLHPISFKWKEKYNIVYKRRERESNP